MMFEVIGKHHGGGVEQVGGGSYWGVGTRRGAGGGPNSGGKPGGQGEERCTGQGAGCRRTEAEGAQGKLVHMKVTKPCGCLQE